jgi:hypothetical protein
MSIFVNMNGGRSGGLKWPVDLLQKYGETVVGLAAGSVRAAIP